MKTTYIYTGIAIAITGTVTGSLWASTGEAVPAVVFAAMMLTILVLGWAGGASAQGPYRTPAAFALSIGSITNTIKTVFTLAEAEQELAALNPPGQYPVWRIVPLFCDDPRYPESERVRPGSQRALTADSEAAINQPLV